MTNRLNHSLRRASWLCLYAKLDRQMLYKLPTVYIMASKRNGTLYTGVTSDLIRRAYDHRTGAIPGFTRRYDCKILVWYDQFDTMLDAIAREKQIKSGSRRRKIDLIESSNPRWQDLYDRLEL